VRESECVGVGERERQRLCEREYVLESMCV